MLEVKNIYKSFDKVKAVNNLSFNLDKGEILGLLGENGAGKTTTFRMIMGLISPDSGTILFDGKKIDYSITDKIGFTTEERSLLPNLTVKEQMIFYGKLKSMNTNTIIKRTDYYLDKFNMSDLLNTKIKELSKGNKQKIQFITSIINNPKLLILDEPFTGLDPINVNLIKSCIYDLRDKGTMIIFSSHQMEYIEEFCERIIILKSGNCIVNDHIDNIRKEYIKDNILIKGDIDLEEIKNNKNVINIKKEKDEYIIKIDKDTNINQLYKELSKYNISKFEVLEPTINQIFIDKIGGKYE